MKTLTILFATLSAVLGAGLVTGCTATAQPQATAPQPPSMMAHMGAGDQKGMMSPQAMCEQHKSMMSTKTPEERQAMMNEHMKAMSPEMRQQHMQMMQEQCK